MVTIVVRKMFALTLGLFHPTIASRTRPSFTQKLKNHFLPFENKTGLADK